MILCRSATPNVRVDRQRIQQKELVHAIHCSPQALQVRMSWSHRMSSVSALLARPACAAAACWFAYQPIVEPLVEFAEEDGEQWRNFPARVLGRLQPVELERTLDETLSRSSQAISASAAEFNAALSIHTQRLSHSLSSHWEAVERSAAEWTEWWEGQVTDLELPDQDTDWRLDESCASSPTLSGRQSHGQQPGLSPGGKPPEEGEESAQSHDALQSSEHVHTEGPHGRHVQAGCFMHSGQTAANIAEEYTKDILQLKELLRQSSEMASTDAHWLTDANLARYAATVGLLKARSEHERTHAVHAARDRVLQSARWRRQHRFVLPEEVEQWTHLVYCEAKDSAQRPVLVIRAAAALGECSSVHAAGSFAEAVVSRVECLVRDELADDGQHPEQLVVVCDARGATSMSVTRLVKIIKSIAMTLNRHYPARLHRLYLVDPPLVVLWPLQALKKLLHPETRTKIVLMSATDPLLGGLGLHP